MNNLEIQQTLSQYYKLSMEELEASFSIFPGDFEVVKAAALKVFSLWVSKIYDDEARITTENICHVICYEELSPRHLKIVQVALAALGVLEENSAESFIQFALSQKNTRLARQIGAVHDYNPIKMRSFERRAPRSPIEEFDSPLENAFASGDFDRAIALLNSETNISIPMEGKALFWIRKALNCDREDVAMRLLDYFEFDDNDFRLLIYWGCKNRFEPFVMRLAEMAIKHKNIRALSEIWHYGIDIRRKLPSGSTLLHRCARKKWSQGIAYLRQIGANFNETDSLGRTALSLALSASGCHSSMMLLVEQTNCDLADINGYTPLHYALADKQCKMNLIRLLLQKTNLTFRDHSGLSYYIHCDFDQNGMTDEIRQNSEEIKRYIQGKVGHVPTAIVSPRYSLEMERSDEKYFAHIHAIADCGERNANAMVEKDTLIRTLGMEPTKRLPKEIQDALQELTLYSEERFDLLVSRIREGELVFIPVLCEEHIFYLAFSGGFLAIIDRASLETTRFFEIEPDNMEQSYLVVMKRNEKLPMEELYRYCCRLAEQFLKGRSNHDTDSMQLLSPSSLKTGNCTYGNLMGAIRVAFLFIALQEEMLAEEATLKARDQAKRYATEMRLSSLAWALEQPNFDPYLVRSAAAKLRERPLALALAPQYGRKVERLFRIYV